MSPDEPQGSREIPLEGELTFETVSRIWDQSDALLAQGVNLVIDLKGVSRADSAGLALLVGLLRKAQQQGKSLKFRNIPQKLMAIAGISGVAPFLTVH